jgi:hypothetical protein
MFPVGQVYDAIEFPALVEKYATLNWRIISKPGGATVKPDEFYTLYGCARAWSRSRHAACPEHAHCSAVMLAPVTLDRLLVYPCSSWMNLAKRT